MQNSVYFLENNEVFFAYGEQVKRICSAGEKLAMIYDSTHGGVMKHGCEADVKKYLEGICAIAQINEHAAMILHDCEILTMKITEETIQHLNNAKDCVGYVFKLTRTVH